jgi:hypothetical protein
LRVFIVMYSWHDWYGYTKPETGEDDNGKQDIRDDDN